MESENLPNFDKVSIFWLPLIIFLIILGIFSVISLQVFLDFLTYNPVYDQIISLLVFLSFLTTGLIGIYSYQAGNSVLLFLIFLLWAMISIPLGLFRPIWFGIFLISLISILIIIYGVKNRNYYSFSLSLKSKKAKITLFLLILTIAIHPIVSFSLSQTTISLNPGDEKITPRFYYADLPHHTATSLSENVLDNLKEYNAELFLPVQREGLKENSKTVRAVRKLNDKGIIPHTWLLESVENGYWANDYNYDSFKDLFDKFEKWKKQENLEFGTIQLDSEKLMEGEDPASFFQENKGSPGIFEYFSSLKTFYKKRNTPERRKASKNYEELVEEINENYKSSVASYPIIIEDLYDEDTTLQDIFAVSTYPPKNWDEIVPMIYRIGFYRIVGRDLGSYLVYSFSYSWKEKFPQKANIALSRPDKLDYSENLEELEKDALVLNSLDHDYVTIFGIGLLVETHGEDGLNRFLKSLQEEEYEKIEFSYEPLVSYSRLSVAFLDRLL